MVTKMVIKEDLHTLKLLVSGLPKLIPDYIFVKVMVTKIKIDCTLAYLKTISIRVARIVVGLNISKSHGYQNGNNRGFNYLECIRVARIVVGLNISKNTL